MQNKPLARVELATPRLQSGCNNHYAKAALMIFVKWRHRQDSNLRGRSPIDFESIALTTRPRCLVTMTDKSIPGGTRTPNLVIRSHTP